MAKLPTSLNLSGPESLRSGRVIASYDTSAIGRGLANLGDSLSVIGRERRDQENALDITRAEAYKTEGLLSVQNEFDNDPDYSTYDRRAPGRTAEVINKAANLIRDPKKRELWLARAESDRARVNDGIFDKGVQTQRAAEIIAFDDALEVNRRIYVDPNTSDEAKEKARSDISASISMAQEVGLLDPVTAEARRKAFIEDANFSRAKLAVEQNPDIIPGQGQSAVDTVVSNIIRVESGGKANAKNPRSSASGLGQFIDSTWLTTVKKHRPDIANGKSNAEILALKSDPALGREMTERYVQDNASILAASGHAVTPGNLYLAHFLGPGGAKSALSHGDNESLSSFLSPGVISANPFLRGHTVGWLKNWADKKMGAAPGWYKELSPEQQAVLSHQAEAQRQKNLTVANAQATAERAARKDDYSLRIATRDVTLTPQEILNDPVIDNGDKASLITTLEAKTAESGETAAAIAAFAQGRLNPDPYDSKGVGLVDKAYDEMVKHAGPEQIQPLAEEMVRQSGVVPQPALNVIRGALAGTDEAAAMAALQSARRISAIDPAALARRSGGSDVQTSVDDFNFYVDRLNMSPDEATRRIMSANDPQKRRDRKALEPLAKDFIKQMESFDIADSFDTFFGWEPELGFNAGQAAGMKAELLAMAEEQFYAANGDPVIAENRAVEEFKRLYGVSEFSGKKVVTRHPPEKYWPKVKGWLTDPLGYAKEQLAADALAADPGFNIETMQLVPTRETEAMIKRGELPGYAVLWTDENGVMQTLPGKLWRPDVDIIAEQRQKAIDDARQKDSEIRAGRDREQNLDSFLESPEGGQ